MEDHQQLSKENIALKLPDFINKDINLKELFRGSSIALIFKVAGAGMGYVFFWVISRMYGAETVGVFSLCWTILIFSAMLGKAGLDSSIVRFLASMQTEHRQSDMKIIYRKGLTLVLFFSILVALLLLLIRKPVGTLFFDQKDSDTLIIMVVLALIPFSVMSYNSEALRGLKKIGLYSLLQNGAVYFAALAIIILIWFLGSDTNFILQAVVISLALASLASLLLYKNTERKIQDSLPYTIQTESLSWRHILKVSFPMMIGSALFMMLNWTDILVLGIYRPEKDVGIYNIAVKIAALNSIALVAINTIAAPKFAELHALSDKSPFRKLVKQVSLINTLVSLPVFLFILFFPEFLLKLFGSEFGEGKHALLILASGQFFNALCGSTMYVMNMSGMEIKGRNIMIASALINLCLNFLLIPQMGLTGGAIATMSSIVVWNVLALFFIYREHGFVTLPLNMNN